MENYVVFQIKDFILNLNNPIPYHKSLYLSLLPRSQNFSLAFLEGEVISPYFSRPAGPLHIPSKTSRSVSSVPWITPEIRRKIRRKNITHAKAKKTGSAKIRSKFENLRREIKADIRKQHDLQGFFLRFWEGAQGPF